MPQSNATRDEHGFVYLMKRVDGLFRIGCAKNPKRRLKELRYQHKKRYGPACLSIIHLIESSDKYAAESELHSRFLDRCVPPYTYSYTLEFAWFALDCVDVDYIKGITDGEELISSYKARSKIRSEVRQHEAEETRRDLLKLPRELQEDPIAIQQWRSTYTRICSFKSYLRKVVYLRTIRPHAVMPTIDSTPLCAALKYIDNLIPGWSEQTFLETSLKTLIENDLSRWLGSPPKG